MNIKKLISILLSIIFTISALPFNASAEAEKTGAEYVEGEIIITSSKNVVDSEGNLYTMSDDNNVYLDFDKAGIDDLTEVETYSEENMYIAEVAGNVSEACDKINKFSNIYAEPNYILHTTDFVMPTEVSRNLSIYSNYQKWYLNDKMHFPEAWQKHEVTGAGVTVAVIDDGYYTSATDFPVNLWKNSNGTIGWNTNDNNDNISPIYKSDGTTFSNTSHGSNVAGVIGMASNGLGGIGGAYGAELMLIQAARYTNDTDNPSFTTSAIVSAIDYAREHGADIINMSLGSTTNSSLISSAVTRAVNAGILVIAAAGNNGKTTSSQKFYPASLSNVLGVMAIDKENPSRLSSFSNYDTNGGQYYNIAAPGVSIVGCSVTVGNYTSNNGTSQATPLVAAAAALYMEKYPDRTAEQLKNDMLSSATETVTAYSSTSYTYKSLNVLNFLDYNNEDVHEHIWSSWVTVNNPTCTLTGLEKRECSSCDEYETRTVAKLGHNYLTETVKPTCEAQGYTVHTCSRCNDSYKDTYVQPSGHNYSNWEITKAPSSDFEGLSQRECSICHDIQTRYLPNVFSNCDVNDNLISGIAAGTSRANFMINNVPGNEAYVHVTPSADRTLGTGSQVTVTYYSGEVINYSIVIFGDLNGDGWYDGTDSIIDSCIVNGMLNEDSIGTPAYTAADCNHDGVIDDLDVQLLNKAGLLLAQIDQSKSTEELLESSSVFNEYINMISQTAESETSDASSTDTEITSNIFDSIIIFIREIIAFIKSAISLIK